MVLKRDDGKDQTPSKIVGAEAKTQRKRARADRAAFLKAHHKGMNALKRRDFDALGEAIKDEGDLIEKAKRRQQR
jgi:hypothetical protein